MNKCGVCKRYEEGECPCHLDIDDELCDFAFELIDIKEHDAKVRADAIAFVNEIISLCEDDGNDEVLKEVLCRKLLKYGFIRLVDDEYVLEQKNEMCDSCIHKVSKEDIEALIQQGREDAYTKMENEINYLLNCGMGKKKGLEHLLKICKEEQK